MTDHPPRYARLFSVNTQPLRRFWRLVKYIVPFALLGDDDWRRDNRVDWVLSEAQKEELELPANETVWAVAHARVTVAFLETNDAIAVVYVNRRSAMHPGWL